MHLFPFKEIKGLGLLSSTKGKRHGPSARPAEHREARPILVGNTSLFLPNPSQHQAPGGELTVVTSTWQWPWLREASKREKQWQCQPRVAAVDRMQEVKNLKTEWHSSDPNLKALSTASMTLTNPLIQKDTHKGFRGVAWKGSWSTEWCFWTVRNYCFTGFLHFL